MVFPLGDLEKTRIVPWVTYALMALNTAMYGFQLTQPPEFTAAYAATPYEITRNIDLRDVSELPAEAIDGGDFEQAPVPFPVRLTLLTAQLLHGDPLHLAFNMLFLWIFGDNVEEVLGRIGFVAFYFVAGTISLLTEVLARPDSFEPILGASGAVAAVMGAYLVWFPRYHVRVLVLRWVYEIRAIWFIGIWIAGQVVREFVPLGDFGGVAYLAHLTGASLGMFTAAALRRRARRIAGEPW